MPLEQIHEPWASFLSQMDDYLDEAVDLHCFGGFVVTTLYGLARSTADVDVLLAINRSATHRLITMAGKESELHQKSGIYLDVVTIAQVSEDYDQRLTSTSPSPFANNGKSEAASSVPIAANTPSSHSTEIKSSKETNPPPGDWENIGSGKVNWSKVQYGLKAAAQTRPIDAQKRLVAISVRNTLDVPIKIAPNQSELCIQTLDEKGRAAMGRPHLPRPWPQACKLPVYYLQGMEGLTIADVLYDWDREGQTQRVRQSLAMGMSLAEARAGQWTREFLIVVGTDGKHRLETSLEQAAHRLRLRARDDCRGGRQLRLSSLPARAGFTDQQAATAS